MKTNLKRNIFIKIIAAALFIGAVAGLDSCIGYPEVVHQNANYQFKGDYGLSVPAWKNLGDEWLIIENRSDLPEAVVGRKAAEIIKIRNDLERDYPWLSDKLAEPKLKIIFAKGRFETAAWYTTRTGFIYFNATMLHVNTLFPGEMRRILLHELTHHLQFLPLADAHYNISVDDGWDYVTRGMRPDTCVALNNAMEFFADFYSRVYDMNFPKDSPGAKKILSRAAMNAMDPKATRSRIDWVREYGNIYTRSHIEWEKRGCSPDDSSWAIQEKNSAPYILYAMRLLAKAKDESMPPISDGALWCIYDEMYRLGTGQSRYSGKRTRTAAMELNKISAEWDRIAAEQSGSSAHKAYLFLSGRAMGD